MKIPSTGRFFGSGLFFFMTRTAILYLYMKIFYTRVCGIILASAYFLHYAFTPQEWHFSDNVNLIFHEAGHTIFSCFGDFIHILMGSGFQVLLPLSISGYFFYTRQRFAGAICLMWVGQNFINVSIYAGDAIAMQLPLLGGDGVLHDWNYLLSAMGILNWTPIIATTLSAIGFMTIGLGILLSFMFAWDERESIL
jgi:hypothetical protein